MQKALPKGWKWVKLGEVCSINPPKPKLADEDDITFLPMSSVSNDGVILEQQTKKYREVQKGYTGFAENDILFAKITPCMENGKGAIARGLVNAVGFGSTEFHVIRTSQQILPELIFRYLNLKPIRRFAEANMTGSAGQKRVPDFFLKTLQFPLPPFTTQHKIVEILEEADNLRKLRVQADEKMKDLIPSLFVQMFGDPSTNPKELEIKKLRDVVNENSDIVGGPFGSNLKVSDYREEGVPIIRLQNIDIGKFIEKDIKYITQDKAEELSYHSYQPGDLILAKLGDPIGKTCLVPETMQNGIVVSDVVRIRVSPRKTSVKFILYALNSEHCASQLNKNVFGTTRPRVNLSEIRNLKIPLPPLPLQQEFARLVEDIEAEKARQAESKKKLDELFNSLMQRAFTGELAV